MTPSLGCVEVDGFEARLLGLLPAVPSLELSHAPVAGRLWLTERPGRVEAASALGLAVLNWTEWAALIVGAENGRAAPAQFSLFVGYKLANPTWRVTVNDAVGELVHTAVVGPQGWTVGSVLRAWGCELVRVYA